MSFWRCGLSVRTPFHDRRPKYLRASINNFRLCEYVTDLNGKTANLAISTSRNEGHTDCTFFLLVPVTSSSTPLQCSLNPILTMRFAVSLKRSADPNGGQAWRFKHFSSIDFAGGGTSSVAQLSAHHEDIEMDATSLPNDQLQTRGPSTLREP